jgi:hypothetical protein
VRRGHDLGALLRDLASPECTRSPRTAFMCRAV